MSREEEKGCFRSAGVSVPKENGDIIDSKASAVYAHTSFRRPYLPYDHSHLTTQHRHLSAHFNIVIHTRQVHKHSAPVVNIRFPPRAVILLSLHFYALRMRFPCSPGESVRGHRKAKSWPGELASEGPLDGMEWGARRTATYVPHRLALAR